MFERYKFDSELKQLDLNLRSGKAYNERYVRKKIVLYREMYNLNSNNNMEQYQRVIAETVKIIEIQLAFIKAMKECLNAITSFSKKAFSQVRLPTILALLEKGVELANKLIQILSTQKSTLNNSIIDVYKKQLHLELACYKEYDVLEKQFPQDVLVHVRALNLNTEDRSLGKAIETASIATMISLGYFSILSGSDIKIFSQYEHYVNPSMVLPATLAATVGMLTLANGLLREYNMKAKKYS